MKTVNNCPTRCDYVQFIIFFCKPLYMFRVVTPPNIRSTHNCNYSTWPWSTLENAVCVKSAKDERYVPVSATFHDRGR